MSRGVKGDIIEQILDPNELNELESFMAQACSPTAEESAAFVKKFVPSAHKTSAKPLQDPPYERRHVPPVQPRREYPLYEPRALMSNPPDGPEFYYSQNHHHHHRPPSPPRYHDYHPPPPPPPVYYEHYHHHDSGYTREPFYDEYAPMDRYGGYHDAPPPPPHPHVRYEREIRETITHHPRQREHSRPRSPVRDPPPPPHYARSGTAKTESAASYSLSRAKFNPKKVEKQPAPEVIAPHREQQQHVVVVAAPVFTAVNMSSSDAAQADTNPAVVASSSTETTTVAAVVVPPSSVGPPEQKPAPQNATEAVANISGFVNLSNPCAKPMTDITDMTPLKTLRNEFVAERMAGDTLRPGVEIEEIGFAPKQQQQQQQESTTSVSLTKEDRAVEMNGTDDLLKIAALEKAHHEEAKKRLEEKKRKGDGEKETKEKKHKKKKDKKHREGEEEKKKKKKKKQHKDDSESDKEGEEKKKNKKKKKKDTDKKESGESKEEDKKKKKKKKKKEDKKEKERRKKKEERKKRREERLVADEASEASDDEEEEEDGSLDSEEVAAENENSDILSDTSGEDASEEDSEADVKGNLKGFVDDEVVYESGASEDSDAEEIHGRDEHVKFAESGPRVRGKKARKLKKLSAEQEAKRKAGDNATDHPSASMHKTQDIGETLLREQNAAGGKAKKKRLIDDDDDEEKANEAKKQTPPAASAHASKVAKSAEDADKIVPLSLIPSKRTGDPLNRDEIEPILCSLAQCIAGYTIANWHSRDEKVNARGTNKGAFYEDFVRYTRAVEAGKCTNADLPTVSVFRTYFGPDYTEMPADSSDAAKKEDLSKLCLNGLARRLLKEFGRIGLLPAEIVKPFISEVPSAVMPSMKFTANGENFRLMIYGNGKLVHEMDAAPEMKEFLGKVFTWFRAYTVFEDLITRFVEKTYGVQVTWRKGTEVTSKRFIKSFDGIANIVNNDFVGTCSAEIHKIVADLLDAPAEAAEFLADFRRN